MQTSQTQNKNRLKELEINFQQRESINAQVENLKKQLRLITENYYYQAYQILNRIIALRNLQMKNYGVRQLSNEKELGLTRHQVYNIMLYKFISKENLKKIDEGKVKASSVLYVIRADKKYREPEYQNKAIDKYEKGEMKITESVRMKERLFNNRTNFPKEEKRANVQLQTILSSLKRDRLIIESKRNLFSDKRMLKYILHEAENFVKEIESTLKFGKRIK